MDYDKQYKTSLDKPVEYDKGEKKGMKWFGITLAVIGFLFFFERFLPVIKLFYYWPLVLIVVGAYFIWNSKNSK
jgi:LiaI-LiaF-like transmembrane region